MEIPYSEDSATLVNQTKHKWQSMATDLLLLELTGKELSEATPLVSDAYHLPYKDFAFLMSLPEFQRILESIKHEMADKSDQAAAVLQSKLMLPTILQNLYLECIGRDDIKFGDKLKFFETLAKMSGVIKEEKAAVANMQGTVNLIIPDIRGLGNNITTIESYTDNAEDVVVTAVEDNRGNE